MRRILIIVAFSQERSSSALSTKSSLVNENSTEIPSKTFSLLRQHLLPTNPHTKIEKSTYDNLTNATIHTDNTKKSTTTQNKSEERQLSSTRNEFSTKRSQSVNLKTPFTLKLASIEGTTDESERPGSVHNRTNKSLITTKDPLCNLNVASCSSSK